MEENKLILGDIDQLVRVLKKALAEHDEEKSKKIPPKLYTINQVAKMLKMSHSTVTKKIKQGLIKTNLDGKTSEDALNAYLEMT